MKTIIWLWVCYALGAWSYILLRAWIKVTGPDHSIQSYGAYFKYYWPLIQYRIALGAAIYWLTFYPDLLADLIRRIGWSSLGTIPELPHIGLVGFVFGLFFDMILDVIMMKIPSLQSRIPPLTLAPPKP